MIEITNEEQIERLNARVVELLREVDGLRQALEQQRYENVKIYDCAKRYAAQLESAKEIIRSFLPAAIPDDAKKRAVVFLTDENSK